MFLTVAKLVYWIVMLVRDDKKAIHDFVLKAIVIKKLKKSDLIMEKMED